jgi:hypothetical protein
MEWRLGVSWATPSMARGSLATPFPFLSKTEEREGGQRTPDPKTLVQVFCLQKLLEKVPLFLFGIYYSQKLKL